MSSGEIVVLTAIVSVFVAFGAVLFGVAWYCGRANPHRHAPEAAFPPNAVPH